jgi:hypothetical protein
VIGHIGHDQYAAHLQQTIQRRDSFLREIDSTKAKARWLVWTGLLSFAMGIGLFVAADLSSFGHGIESIPFWLVSSALAALGMTLLIVGIVLRIVATSRRRRVEGEFPLPPWQGAAGR